MDSNSTVEKCMACQQITTINVYFNPGERIYTCSNCGQVIRTEQTPGIFSF